MVKFSRMFVLKKSTGPQVTAVLVPSLPETKKTQVIPTFVNVLRSSAGSIVLKHCPGDCVANLLTNNHVLDHIGQRHLVTSLV